MKAERSRSQSFLPMWRAFWPLGALAASWHYLPRVDGTVYGLRDDRHAPYFCVAHCSSILRILLFNVADDSLPAIVHMDVLDADKLLPAVTQSSKNLNLHRISS